MQVEDFHTAAWKRLEANVRDRMEYLRMLNDDQTADLQRTQWIRGSISECKRILALAEEASASPAVLPDGSEYFEAV